MGARLRRNAWGHASGFAGGKSTGIRSYLIKKGLPYREEFLFDPQFQARILPAVRLFVVPILETPEGRILQDTTDMIEHLEAEQPQPPMVPGTPVQRVVAWLLGAFGSEGLLSPGMHYRWSYRAEQENFLCAEFGRPLHRGPDRTARSRIGAHNCWPMRSTTMTGSSATRRCLPGRWCPPRANGRPTPRSVR
jgi:glutathione S-transferase